MRQRFPSGAAGSSGWPVSWSRASGIPERSDSYPCPCCRGAQWPGAPPATDRQARSWRWMFLMGAANITLVTAGVVIGGGFRSFIFLGYYPTLAVFAVVLWSSWPSLACTTAQLPRERGRRRMEGPGRAARQGLVDIRAKTPARGRGPKPQSSERGQLPFESDVVAFGRQQLAGGGRSAPGLRPAVRRTGCANRNVGVQRPFPECESLPRTIWVQGLFPHRNQDKS